MTLSLYNVYKSHKDLNSDVHNGYAENVFCWVPDELQWWITGFNTDFTEPDPEIMVAVASVNFTGHEELNEAAKLDFLKKDMKA